MTCPTFPVISPGAATPPRAALQVAQGEGAVLRTAQGESDRKGPESWDISWENHSKMTGKLEMMQK